MRTVREIIKQKGPHSNFINVGDTVLKAAAVMKSKNISYLIVRKNRRYAGIISERDCVYKLILKDKHPRSTFVNEIMNIDLPVTSLDDKAEQCMILINSSKSRYLSAFDGDKFKGIITIHDLIREAIDSNEQFKGTRWYVD
ncbi:MAG TPA: CBS domain-containing protein [Puia sp.]|jgi:CBS domain-containing protein|nr:CBS domain-containing protein [Puia sp.]